MLFFIDPKQSWQKRFSDEAFAKLLLKKNGDAANESCVLGINAVVTVFCVSHQRKLRFMTGVIFVDQNDAARVFHISGLDFGAAVKKPGELVVVDFGESVVGNGDVVLFLDQHSEVHHGLVLADDHVAIPVDVVR